jgi:hypothetical protein
MVIGFEGKAWACAFPAQPSASANAMINDAKMFTCSVPPQASFCGMKGDTGTGGRKSQ